MSKTENGVSTAVSTAVTAAVPSINYAEVAQERVLELRRWREQIPHFATPETTDATKRLSSAASVSPEFIELTTVAVANHTPLVRMDGVPPAQVRELVAYSDAFSPLADELEALAQFVRYSTTAARNTAGSEALLTYSMASRLAKRPATAYLAPYVADMRRALGRGRKPSPEAVAQKAKDRADKAAARAEKAAARAAAASPEPPATPPKA